VSHGLRLSACVATVTLLVAGCSSGGGTDNTPAPVTSAPSTPPVTTPSATAAAPTGQNLPTDAAGRVAQWYAGVAGLFAAIQVDTEHIKADATAQDVQSLQGHCASLRTDAAKVQGAPTAPDKRIAAAVATAMNAYASAAQSCLQGDYPTTATQINKGGAALESANAIMNNLS
jgi:hypothetical protein